MKINLHMHSNYSLDGALDINDLIEKCKKENFDIISVTDHNTCKEYEKIKPYSDIKIVNGLEADAIINNHTYDFLCYDFDIENVSKYCTEKYKTIEERQNKIFKELVKLCYKKNIRINNIESYNPREEYAHPAIYRMLNKYFLDYHNISNANDFYRRSTIDEKFPLYIDMHIVWPDIEELLDVIHKNNGKVFLAHPYRYNKKVEDVLSEAKCYVDGIEICNNPNSKEEVDFLYKFAKNNNLLISCGSDYHGNNRYNMNCKYISQEMYNDIISWMK